MRFEFIAKHRDPPPRGTALVPRGGHASLTACKPVLVAIIR